MSYTPEDHMIEWLSSADGIFQYDADPYDKDIDPWNPNDEEPYDPTDEYSVPVTPKDYIQAGEYYEDEVNFDPDQVENEIKMHAEAAKRLIEEGCVNYVSSLYTVFPDGRWHFDAVQAYALWENDPYVDPYDWLQQASRIRRDEFLRYKEELERELDGIAAVGEGTEKWNVFVVRGQFQKEKFDTWAKKHKFWRGFPVEAEWVGVVKAQGG